jgi:hypothetical protein
MSALLTPELAKEGFALARPSIEALLASERAKRPDQDRIGCHVVALDPTDGMILYEESFGDEDWVKERGYDGYALDKANQAFRDGSTGDRTKWITPWRFRPGDFRYAGAAYEDGYAVATSGLKDNLDIMVSWTVFNWTAGLCVDEALKLYENKDAPPYFP